MSTVWGWFVLAIASAVVAFVERSSRIRLDKAVKDFAKSLDFVCDSEARELRSIPAYYPDLVKRLEHRIVARFQEKEIVIETLEGKVEELERIVSDDWYEDDEEYGEDWCEEDDFEDMEAD